MSFIKNIAHTFISKICLMALGIISSMMVARLLGPENNGKAIILLTTPTILFMLGNFGYGSALSYFSAKRNYNLNEIVGVAIIACLVFSLFMILCFYLTFPFQKSIWYGISSKSIFFAVMLTPLFFAGNFLNRILVGYQKITLTNNVSLFAGFVKVICIGCMVYYFHRGVQGVLEANAISLAIIVLLFIFYLKAKLYFGNFNKYLFYDSWKYGKNIYLALLMSYLNLRLDLYLLKALTVDDASIGYYSVAVAIAEMSWMLPESISNVLFPYVAAGNNLSSVDRTIRSLKWNSLIMIIGAIFAIFLAKPAILIVYGKEYLPSYKPLLYLLPGIIVYPITKILGVDIAARGYPKILTYTTLFGLLTNVITNYVLIPKYGIRGAALASSVSYSLMSVMTLVYFIKITNVKLDIFIPKIFRA